MGILVNSNFPELLTQDLYEWYFEKYNAEEIVYPRLVEVINADKGDGMKGTEAIGVSRLKKVPDGQPVPITQPAEGWTWYCKFHDYKDKIAITDDMISDMNDGKLPQDIMSFAQGWGEGLRITEEEAVFALFNKGTLAAGDQDTFDGSFTNNADPYPTKIYDNVPFFTPTGTNHKPFLNSSATGWYNLIVSAGFSATTLATAYTAMAVTNAYNERGEKIKIQPNIILANPSLRFTIDTVLESNVHVASNAFYTNIMQGLVTPVYSRYLDDTTAWFLGEAQKGIRFYDREPAKFDVYYDNDTYTWYAQIKRRFGIVVVNWRYWFGNDQATS